MTDDARAVPDLLAGEISRAMVKGDWDDARRVARLVQRKIVEAQREAYALARSDHDYPDVLRTCAVPACVALRREAALKYPLPDDAPPRIEPLGPFVVPATPHSNVAVFGDLANKINELVRAVNALRASQGSSA